MLNIHIFITKDTSFVNEQLRLKVMATWFLRITLYGCQGE